jgi:hypothetical protein
VIGNENVMTARRRTIAIWGVVYVALTGALAWGLFQARDRQLALASRPEARAEWEAWKESVRQDNEAGTQPVARRVPTAAEPPAMILLRDHFVGVCATLLLVWTAFFGFMAMVITGVMRGTPPPARD